MRFTRLFLELWRQTCCTESKFDFSSCETIVVVLLHFTGLNSADMILTKMIILNQFSIILKKNTYIKLDRHQIFAKICLFFAVHQRVWCQFCSPLDLCGVKSPLPETETLFRWLIVKCAVNLPLWLEGLAADVQIIWETGLWGDSVHRVVR